MDREKAFYASLAVSAFVFAFFWLPTPRLFDIACIFLILLFVPAVLTPANGYLRNDSLIKLGLIFFFYLVFSIIWHRLTLPENFPPTTSDRRFLRVLYFVAIAYAIAHSRLLTAWQLLLVAFTGLLTYLTFNFDQAEWLRAWHGQRVDFGIHNAQHTGVVFATCTLAFAVFTPRFFQWAKRASPLVALIVTPLWMMALLLCLWGVIVSQTRGVWLGLSVTGLLLPIMLVFASRLRAKPLISFHRFMLAGLACFAILGLLVTSFDLPNRISDRLAAEKVTWESLRQAAAHENRSLSSIEVRVASWSAATEWVMEKPFMGWGGRGSRPLIRQSDLFSDEFKENFNHLHNSYLQVLVEIGLIGAAFIIAIIAFAGRATIRSYKRRSMPLDVFLFSWLFFIFWLVVNIFESYIIYPSGTYLVAIVAGFFYSFCIAKKEVCQINPSI